MESLLRIIFCPHIACSFIKSYTLFHCVVYMGPIKLRKCQKCEKGHRLSVYLRLTVGCIHSLVKQPFILLLHFQYHSICACVHVLGSIKVIMGRSLGLLGRDTVYDQLTHATNFLYELWSFVVLFVNWDELCNEIHAMSENVFDYFD